MESKRSMQPIFRPLRGRFKPFGIPWYILLGIIAVCVAGLFVTVATGAITHSVRVAYTSSETVNMRADYSNMQTALARIGAEAADKGVKISDLDLTPEQKGTIEKARSMGLSAGMSEEEVLAAIPKTHEVQEPLLPGWVRAVLFMALPAVVGIALFIEVNRTSLFRELVRWRRFRKSQKTFRSLPMTYVERECDMTYWDACAAARADSAPNRL